MQHERCKEKKTQTVNTAKQRCRSVSIQYGGEVRAETSRDAATELKR